MRRISQERRIRVKPNAEGSRGTRYDCVTAFSLFRRLLATVNRLRVDQGWFATPANLHPKLGPVEPLEGNLARRLLDGHRWARRPRPTAQRALAAHTKREATSRRNSCSLSNASGKIASALSQKLSFTSSATAVNAGVVRTKYRKSRLGTPNTFAASKRCP